MTTLDSASPYTFDSLSDGAALVSGTPLPLSGTAPTVKTAAAKHGARGVRYDVGTAGRMMYDYGSNQTSRSIVADFYFRINTWASSAAMYLAACYSLQSGGVAQGDWRIDNATKFVTIRNSATAAVTSTVALALATWYRASWKITDSTNTQELKIFQGESATPIIDLTSTSWALAANRVFYIGPYLAAAGLSVDYDTLRFADDFPTPFAPAATNYRWNGTLWVAQKVSAL